MIRIDINRDELTPALQRLQRRMGDMTPFMQRVGRYLVEASHLRFAAGVSPDGVPWAPKSPVTLERYGARGSNRVDSRPLFGPSGALNSTINYDAGADWTEYGSNMNYAAAMQFGAAQGAFGTTSRGGPIPWGNIPARPFIGISDEDETVIAEMIEDWLTRVANAAS